MHNQKNYEILFQEKPEPEKKVGMLFVYIVLEKLRNTVSRKA
jgi:hypothetical protein